MKTMLNTVVLILSLVLSGLTWAGNTKIVQLRVEGMTSSACPVLLTTAVNRVKGVIHAEASLESHSAVIEYDEQQTSLQKIQESIASSVGFATYVK